MAFGLGSLTPDDFAAILRAAPPGGSAASQRIPFGLDPARLTPGADGAERVASAMPSFGLGSQMPDGPQVPLAPAPAPAAPQRQAPPASAPAPRMMTAAPLPPPRPAEFGVPAADMPAPNAVPTSGNLPDPAGAPKADEPSFLDTVMRGIQKTDGLLGSIGIGLLSTPGLGQGLGAGLKNYQQAGAQKAATNLANAEFQLKARLLQQETAQEDKKAARENMTAKVIASSLKIPLEQATAFAGNPDFVNSFLRNGYGAPDGYARGQDGTLIAVPGGEKDPNVIKARAQAQAEGVAAGGKDDVQLLTRPDGSVVAVNKSQLGEPGATPAVTPIMSGGSKLEAEAAERRKAVVAQGGDVNDPRYKDYILSGSLPKENQQQLTAADKQAIREGEDNVLSHRNALSQLRRGLELSPKAYEGVTAGTRAMVMTNLPAALGGGGEAAMATREFDNTMSTQMLDSLKAIFGGNPTEGERAALKDIQGISSMPQELREKVIRNTIAKVESRLGFEEQRVNDLRGGTYYKPRTGESAAPQATGPAEASDPLASARAAIAQGADANKVKTRLLKAGIDPKGL